MDGILQYDIATEPTANARERAIARDCVLVVVGSSGHDLDLIHAGKNFAQALRARWIVVDKAATKFRLRPSWDQERYAEVSRVAQSLGAEIATPPRVAGARAIASYARKRQATKILLGSPSRLDWHALSQFALMAALRRLLPGVEVIAIGTRSRRHKMAGADSSIDVRSLTGRANFRVSLRNYAWGVAVTLVCTIVAFPFFGHVDLINIAMLYLLGSAVSGLLLGRGSSALTAVTNIIAFDFFFVPPLFSLEVLDSNYLVTFSAMLIVGLIIANLMIAVRDQTEAAGAREQHTAALYAIVRDLAVSRDVTAMTSTAVRHINDELHAHARVLMCDEFGKVIETPTPANDQQHPLIDFSVAQWVASSYEAAGLGTHRFPSERSRYLPLRGSETTIGVLVVENAQSADPVPHGQLRLLGAIADQLALALERVRLAELAHAAHLAAERAVMRNTLLASISHDLRTPLSAIAGAGSIVAQNDFALDVYRRVTLGRLIEDKARDMSDLLTNVLELVRLESGADVVNRDWHSLSDLVGLAIARHESRLAGWEVITELPNDLPLISVDSNLIVQLLSNLLENAVKYTPSGTRIYLSAYRDDCLIRLVVEDTGPGLGLESPDELFEKFSRGRAEGNSGGIGLGLAICRTVARLHGGEIRASTGTAGGARFEVTLPHIEEPAAIDTPPSSA